MVVLMVVVLVLARHGRSRGSMAIHGWLVGRRHDRSSTARRSVILGTPLEVWVARVDTARICAGIKARVRTRIQARVRAGIETWVCAGIESWVCAGIESRVCARIETRVTAEVGARVGARVEARVCSGIKSRVHHVAGIHFPRIARITGVARVARVAGRNITRSARW